MGTFPWRFGAESFRKGLNLEPPYCGWTKSCTTTTKPWNDSLCKYQQILASHGFKVVQDFVHPQYGCGSKPMVPFWGRCTTHFSEGLRCSLAVRGIDPYPYVTDTQEPHDHLQPRDRGAGNPSLRANRIEVKACVALTLPLHVAPRRARSEACGVGGRGWRFGLQSGAQYFSAWGSFWFAKLGCILSKVPLCHMSVFHER